MVTANSLEDHTMTDPKPGLYPGISRAEYEAQNAANQSLLKKGLRSWAHAYDYLLNPPGPTPALQVGKAMHEAILEPDEFEKNWTTVPMNPETGKAYDRRTKEGKAAWAVHLEENPDKETLPIKDWMFVLQARRQVWDQPAAKALLGGAGMNEIGCVWIDEDTGMACKALLDRVTRLEGYTWVVDVKSTQDASPKAWPRHVVRYGYHIQAAFYLDALAGVDRAKGHDPVDRRFVFLAFEKDPPFCVKAWACPPSLIEQGRAEYAGLLRGYKRCMEADEWPGYGGGIDEFHLPEWAYREVSDDE
jgi:exodeoxyribonuclease VIII